MTRAKRGMNAHRVYSTKTDRATGMICDQRISLNGFYVARDYPEQLRRIRFKYPESGKTLVFLTNNTSLPPLPIAALYKQRWQVDQATPAYQAFFGHPRECGYEKLLSRHREDANLGSGVHLCADRYSQKRVASPSLALHFATDIIGVGFRENRDFMRLAAIYQQNDSIAIR